jgi:uncharacterized RDD family membrane protein YckC
MQSYPPPSAPPPQPGYPGQPDYSAQQPMMQYAGFWIRLVAYIIDGIIVGVPFAIIAAIAGAASGDPQSGVVILIRLLGFLVSIGYFVYFWSQGQTIGMRALSLRVADAQTGGQITIGKAVLRYIGFIISAIPCYIGLIWAAFDGRKQGWHDKIGGTVVVRQ